MPALQPIVLPFNLLDEFSDAGRRLGLSAFQRDASQTLEPQAAALGDAFDYFVEVLIHCHHDGAKLVAHPGYVFVGSHLSEPVADEFNVVFATAEELGDRVGDVLVYQQAHPRQLR